MEKKQPPVSVCENICTKEKKNQTGIETGLIRWIEVTKKKLKESLNKDIYGETKNQSSSTLNEQHAI